jgi:hypothetical protein
MGGSQSNRNIEIQYIEFCDEVTVWILEGEVSSATKNSSPLYTATRGSSYGSSWRDIDIISGHPPLGPDGKRT